MEDREEDNTRKSSEKDDIEISSSTSPEISSSASQEGTESDMTAAPSSNNKKKMCVEKATTSGPASCVIYKGRCRKHEVEAKKTVNRSKKWGKVKDGWGWVYSCKVE